MDSMQQRSDAASRLRQFRCMGLCTSGLLLAAAAASPLAAEAADVSDAQTTPEQHPDIIVVAPALFNDLRAERNLDSQGIASYAASTIDELILELQSEFEGDEEPIFIINGERVYSLDDFGAYPVEIIRQLQVLPRGSATRLGGSPTQRVFSLGLHRRLRSGTATIAPRLATDGGWSAVRGEAIATSVSGRSRGNIALRVRDEGAILESSRAILQPGARLPFATGGNVIGYPDLSGEIDPLLSDSAGTVVTVAPVPSSASPSLADFAAGANQPSVTDLGDFRTLRPALSSYDLNATYTAPLAPWLSSTGTLRLGRSLSRSRFGLPSALLVLDPDSSYSPFSTTVALAFFSDEPLANRYRREIADANVTLTASIGGSWRAILNGKHSDVRELSRTQRSGWPEPIFIPVSTNPFGSGAAGLVAVRSDQANSRFRTNHAQMSVTGSPVRLPAGDATATLDFRLASYSVRSESSFSGQQVKLGRSERLLRGLVDVPLTSRRNGFLPDIGEVTASAEYSDIHYSDLGRADRSILGMTWEPTEIVRLRGSIEHSKEPPAVELLGAATVRTPGVRLFDLLTGDTVDVLYISGGNPQLKPQTTDTRRLSGILRLSRSLGLQLNGEYIDLRTRNFVSSLPPASAAIMLAFPDRFVRDSDGVLTLVDSRPVNFASHEQRRIRYGLSLNAPLGGGARPSFAPLADGDDSADDSAAAAAAAVRKPSTRVQLTVNHNLVLKDEILIRSGLDPVDLLGGGAIGIGGGRLRHQVDGTAALSSGGSGVRVGISWRGPSSLDTRFGGEADTLRFSPVMLLNLRAFADARRWLPNSAFARGLRLSVDVVNLTNDRQEVRNSSGVTPLQYQPGYRDPLGRTVEFEIRKVF